jgi:hypothetical protein
VAVRRGVVVVLSIIAFGVIASFTGIAFIYLLVSRGPAIQDDSTLILRPGGALQETAPTDVVGQLISSDATTVRGVVESLRLAKRDPVNVYTGNWPVPWCALWLDFILGSVNRRPWPKRMPRVVSIRDWARERGRLIEGPELLTYRPKPGDAFLQLKEGQSGVDPAHGHTGFVLRREGANIVTLEGNSSNAVRSRTRPLSTIDAFVRFDHASS